MPLFLNRVRYTLLVAWLAIISVSTLAIIGGSSGSGIDDSPRSIVVSNALLNKSIAVLNNCTIAKLYRSASITLEVSEGKENGV